MKAERRLGRATARLRPRQIANLRELESAFALETYGCVVAWTIEMPRMVDDELCISDSMSPVDHYTD